jgi:23S rRNA pseudouridine2605 synthase
LTLEQLEASRAERLRLNGHQQLHLEDARTWLEETGLCLFLPRKQFANSVAPSFVEAVIGTQNSTPDPQQIAACEALLVRLENDGVAVRLNLQGQPSEQPDYVVATWVLPYVYALRGDRDWRRTPQLTGSRQVSPLAIQTYKLLEAGDAAIPSLRHTLGREVSEVAVLRAITELWQQLRVIPLFASPGEPARWQLLRQRFQKAIAEGASTSQVTAISVLASIYLQAVIAATMEEVEMFLAPLTARSKVREVLRSLVATRQVHTIALGHAPHYYVAGTLPEFAPAPTAYSSSSMPASAYFLHRYDHEEEIQERHPSPPPTPVAARMPAAESHLPATNQPATAEKTADRPRFSRTATAHQDRKPAMRSGSGQGATRSSAAARHGSARPAAAKRPASPVRRSKSSGTGASRSATGRPTASGSGSALRNARVNSHGRKATGAKAMSHKTVASGAAKAGSSRHGASKHG